MKKFNKLNELAVRNYFSLKEEFAFTDSERVKAYDSAAIKMFDILLDGPFDTLEDFEEAHPFTVQIDPEKLKICLNEIQALLQSQYEKSDDGGPLVETIISSSVTMIGSITGTIPSWTYDEGILCEKAVNIDFNKIDKETLFSVSVAGQVVNLPELKNNCYSHVAKDEIKPGSLGWMYDHFSDSSVFLPPERVVMVGEQEEGNGKCFWSVDANGALEPHKFLTLVEEPEFSIDTRGFTKYIKNLLRLCEEEARNETMCSSNYYENLLDGVTDLLKSSTKFTGHLNKETFVGNQVAFPSYDILDSDGHLYFRIEV